VVVANRSRLAFSISIAVSMLASACVGSRVSFPAA
jgi:hypothetical protein